MHTPEYRLLLSAALANNVSICGFFLKNQFIFVFNYRLLSGQDARYLWLFLFYGLILDNYPLYLAVMII